MSKLPDYLIEFTKYKWEFLRRNSDYVNGYKELQCTLDKKYGKHIENLPPFNMKYGKHAKDVFPPDKFLPPDKLLPKQLDFVKKWKIGMPIDPSYSYGELTKEYEKYKYWHNHWFENFFEKHNVDLDLQGKDEITLASYSDDGKYDDFNWQMFEWLYPSYAVLNQPAKVTHALYPWDITNKKYRTAALEVAKTGKIKIEIDLKYSKNKILREIEFLLDEWKKLYDDNCEGNLLLKLIKEKKIQSFSPMDQKLMKEFKRSFRKNLKMRQEKYEGKNYFYKFDLYLKVYDLRKEGKSWSEILAETSKMLKETNTAEIISTVRNANTAAEKLIQKGVDAYVK